jgi:hypothetical protein
MSDTGDRKQSSGLINYLDSLERLMKPRVMYCACGHSIAAHGAGPCSDCPCSEFSDEMKGSTIPSGAGSDAGPRT